MGSRNGHRFAGSMTAQAVTETQHIVRHSWRLRGGRTHVALQAEYRVSPQMGCGGWPLLAAAMTGEAIAQVVGVMG